VQLVSHCDCHNLQLLILRDLPRGQKPPLRIPYRIFSFFKAAGEQNRSRLGNCARPGAGFRTRNSGSGADGASAKLDLVFLSNHFWRPARIKGEIPNARRSDDAVHRNLFRRGVSLRQGVPEVEVAHAHELDLGNRTYPLHSLDDLSHYRIAVPGEILKCPQTAGCNSPSTL
jgi:hypothetical protein